MNEKQKLADALKALEPFAALGGPNDGIMPAFHDLPNDVVVYENSGQGITAGDVRMARDVLGWLHAPWPLQPDFTEEDHAASACADKPEPVAVRDDSDDPPEMDMPTCSQCGQADPMRRSQAQESVRLSAESDAEDAIVELEDGHVVLDRAGITRTEEGQPLAICERINIAVCTEPQQSAGSAPICSDCGRSISGPKHAAYCMVRTEPQSAPTDAQIDAAAEVIWNDRDARHGGSWSSRDRREVVVEQTRATARAALMAAARCQAESVQPKQFWSVEEYKFWQGGLETRFVIERVDGKPIAASRRYSLVLDFSGADPHALVAAKAYADSIRSINVQLADDIEAAILNPTSAPAQHRYA